MSISEILHSHLNHTINCSKYFDPCDIAISVRTQFCVLSTKGKVSFLESKLMSFGNTAGDLDPSTWIAHYGTVSCNELIFLM